MEEDILRIEYCPEGEAVSDFAVEEWFEGVRNGGDFKVSTTLPVSRVRVAVCEGDLPPEDVVFVYKELVQSPTRNGRLYHWPQGFCDAEAALLKRLLWPPKGGCGGHET